MVLAKVTSETTKDKRAIPKHCFLVDKVGFHRIKVNNSEAVVHG